MKITVNLQEAELREAVSEYLQSRGFKGVGSISFGRDGYPDSPDPRERALSFSASAKAEAPAQKRR